jgi:hypothetical protein
MTFWFAMLTLLLAPPSVLPAVAPPVVSWSFDEARETGAVQPARDRLDALRGAIACVPGVRGSGLKFGGFTSRRVRAVKDLPQSGPALTVEAWIAPQEYSWAWTGIVDHDQDARAGFFLGTHHLGHVGLCASVDGHWLGCDSQEPVALLKWAHVAGTFDPAFGFTLYVNGQRVVTKAAKGSFKSAVGLDVFIGMAHRSAATRYGVCARSWRDAACLPSKYSRAGGPPRPGRHRLSPGLDVAVGWPGRTGRRSPSSQLS